MNTTTTFLDDFMDKMIVVPNNINRLLRLIRKLDKRVENIQSGLTAQQNKFTAQIKELREKKISELPATMKVQLQWIQKKQRELFGYSKEKKQIANQLYNDVAEYQKILVEELKTKYKDSLHEEIYKKKKMKMDANRVNIHNKKQEFYYDNKDPLYCYCGKADFGTMVACENPFCEKQWFHTVCIQQKNIPEKWYCSDCMKQREKTKGIISRSYFINPENGAA